jgi:hypothetical protein
MVFVSGQGSPDDGWQHSPEASTQISPQARLVSMALACACLGAVAVTAIYMVYGAYRDYIQTQLRRQGILRERVAFLLWNAANRVDADNGELMIRSSDVPGGYFGNPGFRLL